MACNRGTIEALKLKLKSATKLKITSEKDLHQARNREQLLSQELATVKAETDFLKEQLEDVKNQIAQARLQISMIEICSTSEKCKIATHAANVETHMKGFQELFDKGEEVVKVRRRVRQKINYLPTKVSFDSQERTLFELRMKDIQDKEAQEEEKLRLNEIGMAEEREQVTKEAAVVEAECKALERECAILKKRNNAIMLKLRRKLLETENARRELLKKNNDDNLLN